MANTPINSIYYPVVGDALTPLATRFSTLSTSVENALETHPYRPVDLAALNALTGIANGALASVQEGGATFVYNGTAWIQHTTAVFATASTRDSAYAKAGGAYRVAGAQVYRTDTGRIEQYFGLYNSSSNPQGASVAGWYPVSGKPIVGRLTTNTAQSSSASANTYVPMLWTTEVENSGMFNISNADRFTITQGGLYFCTGRLRGSATDFYASFSVSGTLIDKSTNGATSIGIVSLNSILYLPAGSFITMNYARVGAGASGVIVGQCEFEIQYIGPSNTTVI